MPAAPPGAVAVPVPGGQKRDAGQGGDAATEAESHDRHQPQQQIEAIYVPEDALVLHEVITGCDLPASESHTAAVLKPTRGGILDLRHDAELSTAAGRAQIGAEFEELDPVLVITCPVVSDTTATRLATAEFLADLLERQHQRGKLFLTEVTSHRDLGKKHILSPLIGLDGVSHVQTKLTYVGQDATPTSSTWWSNCAPILDQVEKFSRQPDFFGQGEVPVPLRDGRYPRGLVHAILIGLRAALRSGQGGRTISAMEVGQHLDEPDTMEEANFDVVKEEVSIWKESSRTEFFDDLTGFPLEATGVRTARVSEMDYVVNKLKIWDVVDRAYALDRMHGKAPIPVRWVDINKGSEDEADYRSRLVATETKWRSTIAATDKGAVFSATPPLEALRMLCSYAMSTGPISLQCERDDDLVLLFLDISRAHPHVPMKRELYTELPEEHPEWTPEKKKVGLLRTHLYGVRDAGQNFELMVETVCVQAGCKRGQHHPCTFSHDEKEISFLHHGDDFVIAAPRKQGQWMKDEIARHFIVKDRGSLGPRFDDKKTMVILHRIIRWCDSGSAGGERIEYTADPRHREVLLTQLNMTKAKSVVTPFEKIAITPDVLTLLPDGEAAVFRSAVMRLGFLALDRPDVQYSAKEAARGMAVPTIRHQRILKRCVRYLIGAPNLVWQWHRQRFPKEIAMKSDTDWAGCPITRRSTSGLACRFGRHLWFTQSTTQIPVSLSSAEAETYGVTKSSSRAIGTKYLATDLGILRGRDVKLTVSTDSSSALAITQRRGSGKIRHLEAGCLWVQDAKRSGRINDFLKVPGKSNEADLMTKGVAKADLDNHLHNMNLVITQERSTAIPSAQRG